MGRKVNPIIFRTPLVKSWASKWFAKPKDVKEFLRKDHLIRKFLLKKLKGANVDRVEIEKEGELWRIIIKTAKPGMIIGKGGVEVENLKKEIEKNIFDSKANAEIQIKEVSVPFLSAQIVLENIILDLERRIPFRRAARRAVEQIKKSGAKGIKLIIKGRLDGAEIARKETFAWGKMPLHTLRAEIDYSRRAAHTIYGAVGVRIWIYKGEVFTDKSAQNKKIKNPK